MERSGEREQTVEAFGWAARDSSGHLSPFVFSRRKTGEVEVRVKVLYCGICHSDLHCLKNEWHSSIYPLVPGHEIVGEVSEIGSKVSKFNLGDKVGVGCIVDSCRKCESCRQDQENYCTKAVATYNGVHHDGTINYGGYSDHILVDERYAVKIPHTMPLASAAPLLCAGISMYSPLKYFGLAGPGKHVGIVGLGGLGHIGVRFAKAFGTKVTVVSSTAGKSKDALENLGADAFLISTNEDQMQAAMGTMDGIIDTVSAPHSITPLIGLLKSNGKLVLLGATEKPFDIPAMSLIMDEQSPRGYGSNFQSMLEGYEEDATLIEEYSGNHHHMGLSEKKRRLRVDQVKALEKNFELENKLEPDRKTKLAQELGLQPRQVAVWFQNRRARWKTKQLEKDYGVLKSQYDSLRHNFDSLRRDNDSLLQEISKMKAKINGEEDNNNNKATMESVKEEVSLPEKDATPSSPPQFLEHSTGFNYRRSFTDLRELLPNSTVVDAGSSDSCDSSAVLNDETSSDNGRLTPPATVTGGQCRA